MGHSWNFSGGCASCSMKSLHNKVIAENRLNSRPFLKFRYVNHTDLLEITIEFSQICNSQTLYLDRSDINDSFSEFLNKNYTQSESYSQRPKRMPSSRVWTRKTGPYCTIHSCTPGMNEYPQPLQGMCSISVS